MPSIAPVPMTIDSCDVPGKDVALKVSARRRSGSRARPRVRPKGESTNF
jgi:hypothetical protein